jgi:very-short-patch-repair endonuclease
MNIVTEFCRKLRNNATPAEKVLWNEIRRRNIGSEKFLRQFPIFIIQDLGRKAFYIADFYCAKHKLVIEVDGPIHLLKKEYDANRDIAMREWGFSILRFTNDEVIDDLNDVVNRIEEYISNNTVRSNAKRKARSGWEEQLRSAINGGHQPDGELLEGFVDDDAEIEW